MALGFNLDKPIRLIEVKITAHERYGAKHITVTEDIQSNKLIDYRITLSTAFRFIRVNR